MDVKRVYSMTAEELKRAFRKASRDKLSNPKYWDALMYRTSVLRSSFSLNDVSWILESLAGYPRYSSTLFLKYLVDPLPTKGQTVMDATMILRSVRKLSRGQLAVDLDQQVQFIIAEKISNSISIRDVGVIARVLSSSSNILPPLDQRLRSILVNTKVERISSPSTVLSILKYMVMTRVSADVQDCDDEPFFATSDDNSSSSNTETLKEWFSKGISLSPKFNAKDVLDFAICVERLAAEDRLVVLGHPSAGPLCGVISRLVRQNVKLMKIDGLVRVMSLEIDIDRSVVEKELQYRSRELNYSNSLKLALECGETGIAESVLARLHRFDCVQAMSPADLIQLGNSVVLQSRSPLCDSLLKACLPVARKAAPTEVAQVVALYTRMGLSHELEDAITRKGTKSKLHNS